MRTLWGFALALGMAASLAMASEPFPVQKNAQVGPTIAGAPTADLAGLLQRQGLLNPAKLRTWRSYSFGIATDGRRTTSVGLLLQHLEYQISTPLTLYMEVGLLHNPLGMAGVSRFGPQQAQLVIPALDLIYRPQENLTVSFHFSQMPSRYTNPWWAEPMGIGR